MLLIQCLPYSAKEGELGLRLVTCDFSPIVSVFVTGEQVHSVNCDVIISMAKLLTFKCVAGR